jgi:hypothetical protein
MSNTKYARVIGTTCAVVVALAVCGPPPSRSLVPNREPADAPATGKPQFSSPDELKLCDRRVPPPRC